ncbi:MAG: hypothetical protein PGN22_02575 [Agrobacterium cavarae]
MTRVTDLIDKAVAAEFEKPNVRKNGFEQSVLAKQIWREFDEDEQFSVGYPHLIRMINKSAKKLMKSALEKYRTAEFQLPFDLDGAMSIPDGEVWKIRVTESLSMEEWDKALADRLSQYEADGRVLKERQTADRLMKPYWRQHPGWNVGKCLRQIVNDASKKR